MLHDIYVSCTIDLDCSKAQALPFIWDIKNIEYCEVKADKVEVTKETAYTGTYTVVGHFAGKKGFFAGIPWKRKFSYQLHEKGFHSKEAQQPPSSFDIQGGFEVEELSDHSCQIMHYEQYKLPLKFLILKPFIVLYLKWSQRQEMQDLKAMICKAI